ncbi:hypothetical protein BT96DRAFT_1016950 [Gymnopus androsaceus JB14]|uniref:Uncharacterized protein n=1 Tax=Gymnopus androsaceus JB14 TaxID=1447944 RepID=A0A6A4HZT4_9AGAR|nr:hypothetical protein BT96DRAFT_1016950 [Gymnopus androsaceus JB14]
MDFLPSSSPTPSTPLSNRSNYHSLSRNYHKPLNSSPLARDYPSPNSSPVAEAQARRQSQYKSRVSSGSSRARTASAPSVDSQKALFRDRFKERCLERAEKARAKARASKRRLDASSDGFDEVMDDDMEETDDDIMQSDLYHRLMLNQAHQQRHAFRRSYYADVGSSFDPDMEDVTVWEQELTAFETAQLGRSTSPDSMMETAAISDITEITPEELEHAELEAYAEECERQAALADFEDIPLDELFTLDDEELRELMTSNEGSEDIDMVD